MDTDGNVYQFVISSSIDACSDGTFTKEGTGHDITGNNFVIGTDTPPSLYWWNGSGWDYFTAGPTGVTLAHIGAQSDDTNCVLWAIDTSGYVYTYY